MSSCFKEFSTAVNKTLTEMSSANEFFRVDCPDIFDQYLAAFPEGTNPIFRERTEHDCQCCKQFIRNLGRMVTIKDGKVNTVWENYEELPSPYKEVSQRMDDIVRNAPVQSIFRTQEPSFGKEKTIEHGTGILWNHFYGDTPRKAIASSASLGETIGKYSGVYTVFKAGLDEFKQEHLDEIIDLIDQNAIYRGEEFRKSIVEFRSLQRKYLQREDDRSKELFCWENINSPNCRLRNTVIGTLFTDLANGLETEQAVKKYESKVAPTNYKRPTALITPKMIEQAVFKLKGLDLEDAINRRFAAIEDISVNDVIFVDNNVIGKTRDGITDLLMSEVKPVKTPKSSTEIGIEDFVAMRNKKIELILENHHLSNFVSLTAPAIPDSGILFKWGNSFAWSYDGDVTDSIKEKVKKAGGNVNAFLRCSLAWFNYDDLDIHCYAPSTYSWDTNQTHIYYGNKRGILDVDMNAGGGTTREPVENLSWNSLKDGEYKICVHNFNKRESSDTGCKLEVEFDGKTHQFTYQNPIPNKQEIHMLTLTVEGGRLVKIDTFNGVGEGVDLPSEKWGVKTLTPAKVNMMMLSPNHWENSAKTGNRHWFFILDKCLNPEPTRGIYNEFLTNELEPHRKVFEVLGSKTKCQPSNNQLSGVGFSSTRSDAVTAIADGRPYLIKF